MVIMIIIIIRRAEFIYYFFPITFNSVSSFLPFTPLPDYRITDLQFSSRSTVGII